MADVIKGPVQIIGEKEGVRPAPQDVARPAKNFPVSSKSGDKVLGRQAFSQPCDSVTPSQALFS